MSSAILFTSHDQTIFVVDIPCSLQVANGGGRIFSGEPPEIPFVTPEPKGKKRETFIAGLPVEYSRYHDGIRKDIAQALGVINDCSDLGDWCLTRCLALNTGDRNTNDQADLEIEPREHLPVVLSSTPNNFPSAESISNELVVNQNLCATQLCLSLTHHVLVPASCTFVWSSLQTGFEVMQQVLKETRVSFGLILMDPPWANRSVRNGSKYAMLVRQPSDAFDDALQLVDHYCGSGGNVTIWITNKHAVRERVLQSMNCRDFVLEEEWIWVKMTTKGETVTCLDGVWRRPYEILLVFRHKGFANSPKRRFIFAVPDVHSRKPNLQFLFDSLLGCSRVLELFARNLTSGWCCMGDEVLKFQTRDSWREWPQYQH